MTKAYLFLLLFFFMIVGCTPQKEDPNDSQSYDASQDSLRFTGETHLRNIKQLTFGGNNAEAYWSFDNKQLIFQSDWAKINNQGCDQIYVTNVDGTPLPSGNLYDEVSTGTGRTTCSYFLPDGRKIYSSTHEGSPDCPESVMFSGDRYVWPIYDTYDIYIADGESTELLIGGEGYDAEPTVSPDGKYIIYTSTRSGDLELWRYTIATKEHLQLTDELGYDGGAFFSPDSKKIVWRASRPQGEEATIYNELLDQNLVEPKALNIFIADIDGKNVQQITDLDGANWAPFFHPSGQKILFSTNHHTMQEGGRVFDVFMIDLDGSNLTQITHSGTFDAFPMFSPDGKKLAFASNRNKNREETRDTNIFVADWIDQPEAIDTEFKSWK